MRTQLVSYRDGLLSIQQIGDGNDLYEQSAHQLSPARAHSFSSSSWAASDILAIPALAPRVSLYAQNEASRAGVVNGLVK